MSRSTFGVFLKQLTVLWNLYVGASELKRLWGLHTKAEIKTERAGGSMMNFTSEKSFCSSSTLLLSRRLSRVSAVPQI